MKIRITAALALATAAAMPIGAAAQEDGQSSESTSATVYETTQDQLILTSDMDGAALYVTGDPEASGWTTSTVYEAVGDGWTEVGQIADVALSRDSALAGIVAEMDGRRIFLSIQDVALILPNGAAEAAYVTQLTPEELSGLPEADALN